MENQWHLTDRLAETVVRDVTGLADQLKMKLKIKSVHPLQWITDLMKKDSTFVQKKMFGCEALCLDDIQMLVLAAKEEPWNGLLVCTSYERQESLTRDFDSLQPHSVLKKWLYISHGSR